METGNVKEAEHAEVNPLKIRDESDLKTTLSQRRARGLMLRDAASSVLPRGEVEMQTKFLVKLLVELFPNQQGLAAAQQSSQPVHRRHLR